MNSVTAIDSKVYLDQCPFCGSGRCAVRICEQKEMEPGHPSNLRDGKHAYVLCDSCSATWNEPDLTTCHQYLSSLEPLCPVCQEAAESPFMTPSNDRGVRTNRWATPEQLTRSSWEFALGQTVTLDAADLDAMFQGDQPFEFNTEGFDDFE